MKLRIHFPAVQLLSAAIVFAGLSLAPQRVFSQVAAPQVGPDSVVIKSPAPGIPARQLSGAWIMAVRNGKVVIRDAGGGQAEYDIATLQDVRKAAPVEFTQAQQLIEAGDLEKALPLLKGVAEKFRGLPTPWAQDATAMLGNVYTSLGKFPEAEAAYEAFQKSYTGAASVGATIGKARLAAERGKFAEAKAIVEPLVAELAKKKNLSRDESKIVGQAFFVLGKAAEGEKKLPDAMDYYCRTVAIFYHERSIVAEAQKRIDDLRNKGITTP